MALRKIKFKEEVFNISYDIEKPEKKDFILFLHGWGDRKETLKNIFEHTFRDFGKVFIDLPGFGNSSCPFVIDSYGYAKIVAIFLKEIKIQPKIIVAHSFGGKIAVLLQPENLVLMSSAGVVEEKSFNVKLKIALAKFLKRAGIKGIGKYLRARDAKNISKLMYEVFKKVVNENFEIHFKKCGSKTLIFWGEEDRATSLESGRKISKWIKDSKFFILKGNHFFFLEKENIEFIEKKVLREFRNEKL